MESYRVRVSKDYLAFCSAHFILYRGSRCERLHGHNYRVAAELEGGLDEDRLVFDFTELKRLLRRVTDELDHRMLVPLESPKLRIEVGGDTVRIAWEGREWSFPRADCALLPIENSTAELLARHVGRRLAEELAAGGHRFEGVARVEVEEAPGQSARWEGRLEAAGPQPKACSPPQERHHDT